MLQDVNNIWVAFATKTWVFKVKFKAKVTISNEKISVDHITKF